MKQQTHLNKSRELIAVADRLAQEYAQLQELSRVLRQESRQLSEDSNILRRIGKGLICREAPECAPQKSQQTGVLREDGKYRCLARAE